MKLAVETYAKLMNLTFDQAIERMEQSEETQQVIIKLMFSIA